MEKDETAEETSESAEVTEADMEGPEPVSGPIEETETAEPAGNAGSNP